MDARFYFANLGADVARCISAAEREDEGRYRDSLARGYQTLGYLREAHRPEAYEEGLLLLRGLEVARAEYDLAAFNAGVQQLIPQYSPMV